MVEILQYVALGLAGGILAGLLGIGGAIIVVPALVYFFGFEQKLAQGTTLAMLIPPVGLLAVWQYYQQNAVDFKVAGILCVGMFVGGYFGGYIATHLPGDTLRRVFGVALLLIGLKMVFWK